LKIHYLNIVTGRSPSKTAASFVRPTRTADPAQSFVEAVHQKYATGVTTHSTVVATEAQIMISSKKVAEEVGFDKIRAQLAQLHELKIVLVDGLQVSCAETPDRTVRDTCPKIAELDLSRNLFDACGEIIHICEELDNLRTLKLK
jgi:tubulin-specific chaperone E